MPFEFDGEPPALLQGLNTPQEPLSSLALARPLKATKLASDTVVTFGHPNIPERQSQRLPVPTREPTKRTSLQEGQNLEAGAKAFDDSTLGDALKRAIQAKPADFGYRDKTADVILRRYFATQGRKAGKAGSQSQAAALSVELEQAAKEYPLLTDFARWMFYDSAEPETPADQEMTYTEDDEAANNNFSLRKDTRFYDVLYTDVVRKLEAERYSWVDTAEACADYVMLLLVDGADRHRIELILESAASSDERHGSAAAFCAWLFRKARLREMQFSKQQHEDVTVLRTQATIDAPETEPLTGSSGAEISAISEREGTFRFLDQPAELRMIVYRNLLELGFISLRCDGHHRHTNVRPSLSTSILATCREVHEEARDILYEENTICVNVEVYFGTQPVINKRQLPDSALPRLRSVLLVFDATDQLYLGSYADCDWRQLQTMTGLQHARICSIEREDQVQDTERKRLLLEQVLPRLPANCKIDFGSRAGLERDHVQDFIDALEKQEEGAWYAEGCVEARREQLEWAARYSLYRQGELSGHTRDYRWPKKSKTGALNRLVPLCDEEDASSVVGLGAD